MNTPQATLAEGAIEPSTRRLYFSLCGTALAAYSSYSLARTPVLPLYARHLGLSAELVGIVVAASTLTGIFLKFPAGTLSDLFGRRHLLKIGVGVFAACPFFYLLPHTSWSLILLRMVHGSATAIFGPVVSAVVSDLAPAHRRGAWLGSYAAAQGGGQAAGQMLGGALLSLGAFQYPFLASGLLGVLAFVVLPRVRTSSHPAGGVSARERLGQSLRAILSDRLILLISLATAGQYFGNGALSGFLPLYASQVAGLVPWQIGMIFGVQTGSLLAFRPLLGTISDRLGRAPLMLGGMLTSVVGLVTLPSLRTLPSLLVFALIYGAAFAATSAASMAWITDRATRTSYGTAHGAYGTIFDVGDASGPIVAGFLIGALGYETGFRLIALPVLLIAALLAFTIGLGKNRQDA